MAEIHLQVKKDVFNSLFVCRKIAGPYAQDFFLIYKAYAFYIMPYENSRIRAAGNKKSPPTQTRTGNLTVTAEWFSFIPQWDSQTLPTAVRSNHWAMEGILQGFPPVYKYFYNVFVPIPLWIHYFKIGKTVKYK